jgi:hypothetical protein
MAKKKPAATDFPFGANLNQGKKPKQRSGRRQSAATRQMYAIARRTGQLPYGGS